jgi:hypothetical protein
MKTSFQRSEVVCLRQKHVITQLSQCFSVCTCISLLHLYTPNTVDTLSPALRMTTMENWLKEQFCNLVYLANFLCNKALKKRVIFRPVLDTQNLSPP